MDSLAEDELAENELAEDELAEMKESTMPLFDLSIEELQNYLRVRAEPGDFDGFGRKTLDHAATLDLATVDAAFLTLSIDLVE